MAAYIRGRKAPTRKAGPGYADPDYELSAEWMASYMAMLAGIEDSRRSLSDWLDWMGFIDAGVHARLDRYIGYYEPYATSHDTLDRDEAVQEESRNVARAVAKAVIELRVGRLQAVQPALLHPGPK